MLLLRQYLNVAMLHWFDPLGYMATANCKGRVPAETQGFYLRRKVLIQ